MAGFYPQAAREAQQRLRHSGNAGAGIRVPRLPRTAGADSAVRNADIVLQLNTSAAFRARRFVQGSSTT